MTARLSNGGAFLHCPKTGGMWVQAVLEASGLFHEQIGHEHGCGHHERWAFTVVREPVSWWLSLWKYRKDTGWPEMSGNHPLEPLCVMHDVSCEEWVRRAAAEFPGWCGRLYYEYTSRSTYTLATERLGEQLRRLAARVGWPKLDLSLDRRNVSQAMIPRGLNLGAIVKAEAEAYRIWERALQGEF